MIEIVIGMATIALIIAILAGISKFMPGDDLEEKMGAAFTMILMIGLGLGVCYLLGAIVLAIFKH